MANDLMDRRLDKLVTVTEAFVGKMDSFDKRVTSVENTLDHFAMIHSGQAKKLRMAANARVRYLLPDSEQYKQLRSKYYSWLWNYYQDAFGVTSYTDTRLKHYDAALDWIKNWQPLKAVPAGEIREAAMAAGK